MKKVSMFLLFFVSACSSPSILVGDGLLMSDKLTNTEWGSKQNRIYIYKDQLQLKVGNLLGTKATPFEIVDQDDEYVVYLIFKDIQPTLLGIVQVDHKNIKLIWWPAVNFDPKIVKETVMSNGMNFKIRKKL